MNLFLPRLCSPALSILALTASALLPGSCYAQDDAIGFSRDVRPLLAKRCFACHGPEKGEGGLRLHNESLALAELDSGERAITPGKPGESALLGRIATDDADLRMPPEGEPLSPEEISSLRRWIEAGAAWESHWAFVAPARREPPTIADGESIHNPIDAFILQKLQANGLKPAPSVDRRTLARRVYYDVTGLPPTEQQLADFLADESEDAYERLVDQLLDSPRYGERWARHWLDVVRYAESNSFERDAPKPFAWKYRDYVIRSFNDDKPYDQFIREQLAGDELDEVTTETITATGYYRLGTWDDEPADPLQAKYDDLDSIVNTTGQAFLGLSVGCARCHDHKIDPFPQSNYYGLLAFFADVTPYALPHRREAKHHSLWDRTGPAERDRRRALDVRKHATKGAMKNMEQRAIKKMEGADQRRSETPQREELLKEKLHHFLSEGQRAEYERLAGERKEIDKDLAKLPPPDLVLSLAKCNPHPEPMHIMARGNPHVPGDEVSPHFPDLFGDAAPKIPPAPSDARSSGRRRVLAEWIASPDNRLTSRVIVNRVWQHHFGRGIVRSANNFGQLGTPPTHPKLLDWLAGWLTDEGWRLKPLHRLILTSNTYRMSSQASPVGLAVDPENNLFWRFNMRRLSAEEIRDSVLLVSGQLNSKMYGPSIYPKLSNEVMQTQSRPGENWHTSSPREAARRSIYIHIKRSLIPPELANFDFPDTDASCEARFNTTQAAQALNLLHGEFLQTQARHLAERVKQEAGGKVHEQVAQTLRLALGREPDEPSVADGLALIARIEKQHGFDKDEALKQFCLVVLNLNEFVYLD